MPAKPSTPALRIAVCGFSHPGKIRRRQEDAFVLGAALQVPPMPPPAVPAAEDPIELTLPADGSVVAVIDGMGGHGGGDVAATWLARRWAGRHIRSKASLTRQLGQDHADLLAVALSTRTPYMGAVATGCALLPAHALLFHVGDTRAYRVSKSKAELLTRDDARPDGLLTQAFAGGEIPGEVNQIVPHLQTLPWTDDEILLLISDGAWKYLPPEILAAAAASRPGLRDFVETLAALVLEGRANDNLTLVALRPLPRNGKSRKSRGEDSPC